MCHIHKQIQYLLHQFTSHLFSIQFEINSVLSKFELNWIKLDLNSNSFQLNLNPIMKSIKFKMHAISFNTFI
jgi:hypothetical protein